MTRDEILNQVRKNLSDEGITFWSASDANDSIQDGYDEVAAYSQCVEKTVSVASVADQLFYNFYQLISDYVATKAIYNPTNTRWLDPISLIELKSLRNDWENTTAEPTHFSVVSFEFNIIWPIYTGAVKNFTVLYSAQADTLAGSTVPQIPTRYQDILEYYTTADLLEQAEEITKAAKYWQMYERSMNNLKIFVADRINHARIQALTSEIR